MQFLTSPTFWSIAASISTVCGFGVVIYTAIIALRQLKELTKARHLEAMVKIYEIIGSKEARELRRYIYTQLCSAPESMTDKDREVFEEVSVAFDRIGNLVKRGLVPKDELFATHSEIFIKTWQKLEPYVLYYRRVISDNYVRSFEDLKNSAQAYYAHNYPGKSPIFVNAWSKEVMAQLNPDTVNNVIVEANSNQVAAKVNVDRSKEVISQR